MNVFAAAMGTLFRDRNLARAGVLRRGGEEPDIPVRVMWRAPDRLANFGDGRFVTDTTVADLQIAEV